MPGARSPARCSPSTTPGELRHALSGPAGVNAVVSLEVGGDTHPTVVKDLQRDPVRRTVTHIDFIVVRLDEEITVDVPIILEGEAKAVLSDGGAGRALPQRCWSSPRRRRTSRPSFTVDVSDLAIGDVVRVGDLVLPGGVTHRARPRHPRRRGRRSPRRRGRGGGRGRGGRRRRGRGRRREAAEGGDAE